MNKIQANEIIQQVTGLSNHELDNLDDMRNCGPDLSEVVNNTPYCEKHEIALVFNLYLNKLECEYCTDYHEENF